MKDDMLYIGHIRDCISAIQEYTTSGRNEFMEKKIIQDAVVRNLEIIGEASKNMSENPKERYKDMNGRKLWTCETRSYTTMLALI